MFQKIIIRPPINWFILLIKIVSRGGNLLLNIGPSPQGDWSDTAYSRLKEIGNWMQTGSAAIYNSQPIAPYESENLVFTQSKDRRDKYVFILSEENENKISVPQSLHLPDGFLQPDSKVTIEGSPATKLQVEQNMIRFPKKLLNQSYDYAIILKIHDQQNK